MKIEKIDAKIDLKIQKSLCITTKSLYTNSNFKRNYLENYNNSEDAVKTKNASFFMIFPNIFFPYNCKLLYWSFNPFLESVVLGVVLGFVIRPFNPRLDIFTYF